MSFEDPTGWRGFSNSIAELHEWATERPADGESGSGRTTLEPLTSAAISRIADWLPKLTAPIRIGEHSQTAFSFGLMLDWARATGDDETGVAAALPLARFLPQRSRVPACLRAVRRRLPVTCVAEADLMRRVLPEAEFTRWLRDFLPSLPTDGRGGWLAPGVVTDPTDPKLGHLCRTEPVEGVDARSREVSRRPIRAARRSWPPRGFTAPRE